MIMRECCFDEAHLLGYQGRAETVEKCSFERRIKVHPMQL